MENNRRPIREKKKLRKGLVIGLTLLVLVLAVFSYVGYQFWAGLQIADENKTKPPEEEFVSDEKHETVENYLILGVDARGEEKSRTDTMMLLSWNRDSNEMKVVSFMRDIYADIPNYKQYKLNTAYYLGGVQLLKDTLTEMFDLPFHHYALIDFESFESLIDIIAPNGVEIDVEKNMSKNIGVELVKGTHRLNGQELLGYARYRMDAEGDFGRVVRQQKVMEALKDELLSIGAVKNLPKLVGATKGYITTDITNSEQLKTVLSIATGGSVGFEKLTIPVQGTFVDKNYSHAGDVLEIDLEKNKQILHEFINVE